MELLLVVDNWNCGTDFMIGSVETLIEMQLCSFFVYLLMSQMVLFTGIWSNVSLMFFLINYWLRSLSLGQSHVIFQCCVVLCYCIKDILWQYCVFVLQTPVDILCFLINMKLLGRVEVGNFCTTLTHRNDGLRLYILLYALHSYIFTILHFFCKFEHLNILLLYINMHN
jgi:hypothetical protein